MEKYVALDGSHFNERISFAQGYTGVSQSMQYVKSSITLQY